MNIFAKIFIVLAAIVLWFAIPIGVITIVYWIFSLFFGWVFWFPIVLAIYGVCLLFKWIFSDSTTN